MESTRLSRCLPADPPNGPLSLDSNLYIDRPPLETWAYAEVAKPGSLVRLKAPRRMGKSSLLLRMTHHARSLGYAACTIDFLQADRGCFQQLDRYLRWFCCCVAQQLGLPPQLDDYWDGDLGSKMSCTLYFEQWLLSQVTSPVVVLLNEVNRVFEHGEVAADFLSLLRSWYEKAQHSPLWRRLRLVMAYSSDVYIPLKLDQSPFNVGLQLKLLPFTLTQTQELADRYGLDQSRGSQAEFAASLHNLVGGHPYLVHLAIASYQGQDGQGQRLLDTAASPDGIFAEHLRSWLAVVRQQPELLTALKVLVESPEGLQLSSQVAYQLASLGVIRFEGYQCQFSCELYRRYFQAELAEPVVNRRLEQLEQENQRLQTLADTDALTQVRNRRAFDRYLHRAWNQMVQSQNCLGLILCDIDFFKRYNDTHGHLVGDQCLQLVAQILHQALRLSSSCVARYGGEEFAIVLAPTDANTARSRAEELRSQVSTLTAASHLPKVTISVGVATLSPTATLRPDQLIAAADQALYQSKRLGRDRVTLSATA